MKRILSLTLCLALAAFVATSVLARPAVDDGSRVKYEATKNGVVPNVGAREDTMFLFPSSGAGSWGTAGTYDRGFTFDDGSGGATAAGWTLVDRTAQDGDWWHVASTTVCAGTGTDCSSTAFDPFDAGDTSNDYALWCGRENVCGWSDPTGYGNNWEQWVILDCGAWDTSAQVQFVFNTDFEGGSYDHFNVLVEVDDELVELQDWTDAGAQVDLVADVTALAADYPGQTVGDIYLHFTADGGWSDQDGSYLSDVGAVWVDNVILTVDGTELGRDDFETGLAPAWVSFSSPPGAGVDGVLYSNLYSEDICTVNPTFAWAFFDLETFEPGYPLPVVQYGPPYIDNGIESPVLDRAHAVGDPVGEPLSLGPTTAVHLTFWVYVDLPLNALIFYQWQVAAQTVEIPCLGGFRDNNTVYYGPDKVWGLGGDDADEPATLFVAESAAGGTVTGIAARLCVVDQCGVWCNVYGDGTGHTPSPYFDNVQVMIVDASAVAWNVDQFRRLQDNFPDAETGKVRIDNSDDYAESGVTTVLIGDSTIVELNMDLLGGIQTHANASAGEDRPNLYMYFRVAAGPHAGMTDPMMGDQDDTDGSYCPYMGTADFFGETWNYCVTDSAAWQGNPQNGKYAFDLNDEYFEAGDVIEHFYWAEAVDGTTETRPAYALSSDPDLRGYYIVRCLPTAGVDMLYCNDGRDTSTWWEEGFRYNGYTSFDEYQTQAPTSGLQNGLAGRASIEDIDGYDVIVWDSGDIPSGTITNQNDPTDKVYDDVLLRDWLSNSDHNTFLWIMGSEVAADLTNSTAFLNGEMGVNVESTTLFYDDYTGVLVPKVFATHALLEYLGDDPYFWVDGGCPSIENFSAITTLGALAETSHEWEVTVSNLVAGVLNFDPDGNGTNVSAGGYTNRVLYNPFSYYQVWDAGYGVPAGEDYHLLMVGHVLNNIFNFAPNGAPDDVDDTAVAATRMLGNFPNPFNPTTTIKFNLANTEHVNLAVYDISGRLVKQLVNGQMDAGEKNIVWNGKDQSGQRVASGVYFYKMSAGDYSATDKMVMLK